MTNIRRVEGILTKDEVVVSLASICSHVTTDVHKKNAPEQSHGRWEVVAECMSSRFEVHLGYPQRRKRKRPGDALSVVIVRGFKRCDSVVLDKAAQVIQKAIQEKDSRERSACNFCEPRWWGWKCHMQRRWIPRMTPTVTPTATPRDIAPEIRERVKGYKASAFRGQGLKRDAGNTSTSRQVKGKRNDDHAKPRYPQRSMDLVAVFLQSFHIAFKPYGLRGWKNAHNTDQPPRDLRESQEFIQNKHAEAMEKIQRTAEAAGTRWELADVWLDVGVVRAVADQFLSPFVWQWDALSPPPSVWRWTGVWIYPYEKETILAICMRNFLSVNQEEIRSAAESYRKVRQGEDEWC